MDTKEYTKLPETFSKSNFLIQARYNYTLLCNQTLAISLQKARKQENGEYIAEFSVQEVAGILDKKYGTFYTQMKHTADKMSETKICIENPDKKKFEYHQLIPTFEYDDGMCRVHFNTTLNNVVGDLTSNFTQLSLTTLSKLDSLASYRLYETLKSFCYQSKNNHCMRQDGAFSIKIKINELKVLMNAIDIGHEEISALMKEKSIIDYDAVMKKATELYERDKDKDISKKDKYPKPKWTVDREFKRTVILPAIEEINDKTELFIELEGAGKKKLEYYVFNVVDRNISKDTSKIIVENNVTDEDYQDNFLTSISELLVFPNTSLTISNLRSIAKASNWDYEKVNKAYDVVSAKDDIKNVVGMMISAIEGNWEEKSVKATKSRKKADKFNNFSQRNYDYDSMIE